MEILVFLGRFAQMKGNSRVWKSLLFKTNYFHGQWCSKYLQQASKKQKRAGDSELEKNNTRWVCSFTYIYPAYMCVHIHAQSLWMIIYILTEPSQGNLTAVIYLKLLGRQNIAMSRTWKPTAPGTDMANCIMIIRIKGSLNAGAQELRPGEGQFYFPLQSEALYKVLRFISSILILIYR